MEVHCILIEIFNGKQARPASSMLTRIEVKQTMLTTHALAQILSSRVYTELLALRHCNAHMALNMDGARRRCSVVIMLGHRRQWRHWFGVPFKFNPRNDRLLYPASFSKSITLRV